MSRIIASARTTAVRTAHRITRGDDRLTRIERAEAMRYGEVAMLGMRGARGFASDILPR